MRVKLIIQIWMLLVWVLLPPVAIAQPNLNFLSQEPATENVWNPPEINRLTTNWWARAIDAAPTEQPHQQLKTWSDQLLEGSQQNQVQLSAADLQAIRQFNINLTELAEHTAITVTQAPEQYDVQESYGLTAALERRQQLRTLRQRLEEERAARDELQVDGTLQRQNIDRLIIEYQGMGLDDPKKASLGYQWLEARSWVAIYESQVNQFESQIDQTQARIDGLLEHLAIMRERLVPDVDAIDGLKKQIDINQDALVTALQQARQASLNMARTTDTLNSSLLDVNKLNLALSLMAQKRLELAIARDQSHIHWIANSVSEPVELQVKTRQLVDQTQALISGSKKRIRQWQTLAQDVLLSAAGQQEDGADQTARRTELAQQVLLKLGALEWQAEKVSFINTLISDQLLVPSGGFSRFWYGLSETTTSVTEGFKSVVNKPLFRINETPVTLLPLFKLLLIVLIGYLVSKLVRAVIKRMESRRDQDKSPVFFMLDKLIHYIIIIVATLAGFSALGIDFTNLTLIAGALSVGIGFGLQNIVSNFVSGLTIMFERTLKVGDYIEIEDGITGTVREINARSTRINTNDNIDVVIPNSDLVTNQVINWTLRDSIKRVKIPFGVAYGTDKELVKKAATEAAEKVPYTLTNMKGKEPEVWMTAFGDNSLDFVLLVWVSKYGVRRPNRIKAAFLWELDNAFNQYGIEIPFPQRVLHVASDSDQSTVFVQPDDGKD